MTTGNKSKFSIIHLEAAGAFLIYILLSRGIYVGSVIGGSEILSYSVPVIYEATAGVIFLYLFSHEDFFKFAAELEKKEEEVEAKMLKRYRHLGNFVACLCIGTVGGPVLSALAIRFLLGDVWYKYLLVAFIAVPSTLFGVAFGRGLWSSFK